MFSVQAGTPKPAKARREEEEEEEEEAAAAAMDTTSQAEGAELSAERWGMNLNSLKRIFLI